MTTHQPQETAIKAKNPLGMYKSIYLFIIVMAFAVNGCAHMSQELSQPLAYSDTSLGDPGHVDARLGIMNAMMLPGVRGSIELSRVTRTVFDVMQTSGGFRQVTPGKEYSDYIIIPTIVDLRDVFDNVVHLRIQGKSCHNGSVVYDHKFVGWNFSQGASLKNIAELLHGQLPIIRAAISADMERAMPVSKAPAGLGAAITTEPIQAAHQPKTPIPSKTAPQLPSHYSLPKKSASAVYWAVIIGISDYRDSRIPSLRYAERDANSFYSWIVSKNGGKYSPSRVKLLIGRDATTENIKTALFSWLQTSLVEDVVTIYFAGHGAPASPDAPDNLYLLSYDCKYDNVAATAFPMWDVETALKRFIRAKKVVIIADACHSGGVGQSFDIARRANRGIKINQISSGIQNLSQVGDGVCVISASSDKQFSQESQKWGGGHGIFTYFLLKGLKGDADYNKDISVTLGELTSYLSEQVRRETRNAQSPTVAGRYDPALTIGR